MKIAFSKPTRDEEELATLLTGYRAEGYEGLQLKMGQFLPFVDDAEGFRSRWGDDPGTVSGLIFFDDLSDGGKERLQATIDFAGAVGAERVIFCHNRDREGVTPEVLRGFAGTLADYAQRAGDRGVRFSLHHHYGQPVMLPDDVEEFFGAADGRIGLTVDTAHLAKSGIEDIPGFLSRFADIVDNIHLKDYAGGEWRLLGEGELDLTGILGQLRSQGFQDWLCVDEESAAPCRSACASRAPGSTRTSEPSAPPLINDEGEPMSLRSGRTRARVLALGAAAAVAAVLTACSPGGAGGGAASEAPKDGKVTLTWWDYYAPGATEDALLGLLDKYQKENPNVTVERQFIAYEDLKKNLLQSAGAAALPDIVVINGPDHAQFAELGIAADLTDKLKEWGELDKYPKGVIQSSSLNGKNYGVPITANCLALFYNKALLADAGLKPPTTWDELESTAKALTTPDHYGFAYSAINNQQAVFQWLPTLWQAGGDLTKLDSPQAATALEYWSGLMQDGSVSREALNWDQAAVASEFAQGRAAMMINGPWQLPFLAKEAPNLDYGVALLPAGKEKASALGGENYMIVDGPHTDAAWDLVKWMQKPENVEALAAGSGSLPTRTDVDPFTDDANIAVFADELKVARPRAYGANYAEIADQVVAAIQSVLTGSSDAKSALGTAATAVKPLLPKG
ncbi:extracellular solute-binding protein [Naasia aerilata]|uniref:Xylose isomerase-like TIM barrel domain-containing protein n=1 Tax=Naasia aerilata TaxID=1162966 RepID=A0ABN6XL96_9MICO|nr:extracellular solute-binding protein [Naasia aerilata]BDZ44537.1 hypothetical protein GCM10025866_04460 [Naasia aerilata]